MQGNLTYLHNDACIVYYQDILEEIEAHGEILKLIKSNLAILVDNNTIDDDNNMVKTVKQVEGTLHQVWLRTLEWECLLEYSLAWRGTQVNI